MEKFIPYEKLSKKEKRRLDKAKRRDWNGMSPVTRRAENPRAYNRAKARRKFDDKHSVPFAFCPLNFTFHRGLRWIWLKISPLRYAKAVPR